LEFNEAETRKRIIDITLIEAGWDVGADGQDTLEVKQEVKVDGQPTTTGIGYADYVLFDNNGLPLGVIEAKKTAVAASQGKTQAKLYADALEKRYGQRPVIFYSNGFDIWIWDDAKGEIPRKIYGYYSKDSLRYCVQKTRERLTLADLGPKQEIIDRMYQLEAVTRVTEKFETHKRRKALIVLATGTGKTRVAMALTELLSRAGWVQRVLFLCDRRELRK
jgi:type I restriction enzyme R subunit